MSETCVGCHPKRPLARALDAGISAAMKPAIQPSVQRPKRDPCGGATPKRALWPVHGYTLSRVASRNRLINAPGNARDAEYSGGQRRTGGGHRLLARRRRTPLSRPPKPSLPVQAGSLERPYMKRVGRRKVPLPVPCRGCASSPVLFRRSRGGFPGRCP